MINEAGVTRADDQTWGEDTDQYWSRWLFFVHYERLNKTLLIAEP